jgi:phosphoserine phosphatase RsbU/P
VPKLYRAPFDRDELRVRLRAGGRVVELEQKVAWRNAEVEVANQRMRRDLEAAALVQQALLPTAVLNLPEARFAWAFQPCEQVSGDSPGIYAERSHS